MRDFRKLKVWQRGHRLTLAVYEATVGFPREALYGLRAQVRRSASSIPANIAEGCGRTGDAELARFMLISMGSASELEYDLLLARDLDYLTSPEHQKLTKQVEERKKMLAPFIKKLRS